MTFSQLSIILCIGILIVLCIVNRILNIRHPIFKAIKSGIGGPVVLVIINLLSTPTNFSLPMNLFSLGLSALAGIPGIGMIAILNMMIPI